MELLSNMAVNYLNGEMKYSDFVDTIILQYNSTKKEAVEMADHIIRAEKERIETEETLIFENELEENGWKTENKHGEEKLWENVKYAGYVHSLNKSICYYPESGMQPVYNIKSYDELEKNLKLRTRETEILRLKEYRDYLEENTDWLLIEICESDHKKLKKKIEEIDKIISELEYNKDLNGEKLYVSSVKKKSIKELLVKKG